jgi:hypothetical protein
MARKSVRSFDADTPHLALGWCVSTTAVPGRSRTTPTWQPKVKARESVKLSDQSETFGDVTRQLSVGPFSSPLP